MSQPKEVKGIFPKTYVSITRELDDDPITKELRGVLREWGALMRQYYLVPASTRALIIIRGMETELATQVLTPLLVIGLQERRMKEYTTIKDRMKVLLDWHRIITSPHTPPVRAFACDRCRHRRLPLGARVSSTHAIVCVWGGNAESVG